VTEFISVITSNASFFCFSDARTTSFIVLIIDAKVIIIDPFITVLKEVMNIPVFYP
jgi:hypothetical protein